MRLARCRGVSVSGMSASENGPGASGHDVADIGGKCRRGRR